MGNGMNKVGFDLIICPGVAVSVCFVVKLWMRASPTKRSSITSHVLLCPALDVIGCVNKPKHARRVLSAEVQSAAHSSPFGCFNNALKPRFRLPLG